MRRMSQPIIFGTDGWRAVIADGFTFDNVRRVSEAIAVAARTLEPPDGIDRNALVVGFDRRFLSPGVCGAGRGDLKAAGFRVVLSKAPTPSQTISYTAWRRKLLGGVIVTASHNPAKYNGLKFKGWYGGSGLPEMYAPSPALGQSSPRAGGSNRRIRPARRLRRRTAGAARREEGGDAAHPPRSDVRRLRRPPVAHPASRWRRSAREQSSFGASIPSRFRTTSERRMDAIGGSGVESRGSEQRRTPGFAPTPGPDPVSMISPSATTAMPTASAS